MTTEPTEPTEVPDGELRPLMTQASPTPFAVESRVADHPDFGKIVYIQVKTVVGMIELFCTQDEARDIAKGIRRTADECSGLMVSPEQREAILAQERRSRHHRESSDG
jgi:hypothetical protein